MKNMEFSQAIEKGMSPVEKANLIQKFTPLLAKYAAKLESSLVFGNMNVIKRDLDGEYQEKNDTVNVKVMVPSVMSEHSDSGDSAVDFTQEKRAVKLDHQAQIMHTFTQQEWQQALETGESEVLESMIEGAKEYIDNYISSVFYKTSAGYYGTAGTTISAYTDIVGIKIMADKMKSPKMNRSLIVNHDAAGVLLNLDQWKNFSAAGEMAGLKNADLGFKAGMNIYASDYIKTQSVSSTFEAVNQNMVGTLVVASNTYATDGTPYSLIAITEAGGSSTAKVSAGAIGYLTDDSGVRHYFSVIEQSGSASSGVVSNVKITPAVTTACTGTAVVFAERNKTASVRNLLIQKDCVHFTARKMRPYPDIPSVLFNVGTGIPLLLSWQTALATSKTTMKLELLCKAGVLRSEGVQTLLG